MLDLFAGAGGASLGLKKAGFRILGAVENDPLAIATYKANHPEVRVFDSDIRDLDPVRVLRNLGLRPGQLGVLKACPPCQGYSTLGKLVEDDERNDLVREVWRFLKVFRPKAFVVENVPGLQRDSRFDMLLRQARGSGYCVKSYVVDAADFSVPQRRVRLIAIGVVSDLGGLPEDLLEALPPRFRKRTVVADALRTLAGYDLSRDPLHRVPKLSNNLMRRIRAIPRNGSRFDLPEELQLDCHIKIEARHATSSYGRMILNEPAPTMTTRCTTPACGRFIHPHAHRPITLREAAAFQTFPIGYEFVGGRCAVERQIGNAVPVRMAMALGLVVRGVLGR